MTPSPNLVEFLRGWEGPPHYAPREDPVSPGVFDIGYGHVCQQDHPTVDDKSCDDLLRMDVNRFAGIVDDALTIPLAQHEFDAVVSFTFNLGERHFHESTLLKKLNAEDIDGAANEFHKWVRAGGKIVQGLVKRRAAEEDMFVSGDYSRRP